jgi:outer membrane protein OmpA-like peptidoglycan-associated protein
MMVADLDHHASRGAENTDQDLSSRTGRRVLADRVSAELAGDELGVAGKGGEAPLAERRDDKAPGVWDGRRVRRVDSSDVFALLQVVIARRRAVP